MTQATAIQTQTLTEQALRFHGMGFNVFPVDRQKHPVTIGNGKYAWKRWQTERQTESDVCAMPWKLADGIAGLGGPNGLVCVDFDSPINDRALTMFLSILGINEQWAVWTPGKAATVAKYGRRLTGYHVWVNCPGLNLDGKARLERPAIDGLAEQIELRGPSVYAVLPGSPHPDGGIYQFLLDDRFPDVAPPTVDASLLIVAYDAITLQPKAAQPAGDTTHFCVNGNGAHGGRLPWVERAFEDEINALRGLQSRRNNGLNQAAYKLGGYLHTGVFSRTELEDALYSASVFNGYVAQDGEAQTRATIKSGIDRGMAKPRTAKEPGDSEAWRDALVAAQSVVSNNSVDPLTDFVNEYMNGAHMPEEPADAQSADEEKELSPLADLLVGLAAVEDDRHALEMFALKQVSTLAGLGAAELAEFCTHLRGRGVAAGWIAKDLKPAVEEAKPTATSGGAGFNQMATWTDYVRAAERLGYSFRLNDLADTVEVNGERMTDVTESVILSKLHAQNLKSADVARRAFTTAAAQRRYHPVKEYLEGLTWDGLDHIGALALHFQDAHAPILYSDGTQRAVFHAFLRRWLVGAVGKVYNPSKVQNPMLILDGGQGRGKSYFAKWLCPLPELHFEGPIKPDDKDYLGYLTTRWIWEVSELGATMRKSDREALKAFITQQDATFRPAYGRHALVKPALASFIGTVNFDGALLSDPTGHRRFWPVTIESIDWGYSTAVDVNQVWAQAFALYQGGEAWQLSAEERAVHAQIVEFYEVEDILAGYVQEHFVIDPENETLFTYTTDIITVLRSPTGADLKGSEKTLSMQLSSTLNRLGLARAKRRANGSAPRWGYVGIIKR
ncbi:MAG: bifunctional DNA primase/polymerase [Caldilineaceae bacterium]|nr:bifunctional DNA primase/polymerase [Caldilineaceae bacterium]